MTQKQNEAIQHHFDKIAEMYDRYKIMNSYYYDYLKRILRETIPPKSKVIDIGCGTGALLNWVDSTDGLGVDLSSKMIEIARKKFPHLRFEAQSAEELRVKEFFPYVMLVDIFDHTPDHQGVIRGLEAVVEKGSIVCILTANPLWNPILNLAEKLKLKMPEGPHEFVSIKLLSALLIESNYEILRTERRFLVPKKVPLLAEAVNCVIQYIPLLRQLCLIQVIVARKKS